MKQAHNHFSKNRQVFFLGVFVLLFSANISAQSSSRVQYSIGISIPVDEFNADLDFARMSQEVYADKVGEDIGDWRRISGNELNQLGLSHLEFVDDPRQSDSYRGFRSQLYIRGAGENAVYTLSFAGTESEVVDFATDMSSTFGTGSSQYLAAIELARAIADALDGITQTSSEDSVGTRCGPSKLYLTGHSLGGGLATAAAIINGIPAITFNAQGVNTSLLTDYYEFRVGHSHSQSACFAREDLANDHSHYIKAYYTTYDPLSLAQSGLIYPILANFNLDGLIPPNISRAQGRRIRLNQELPDLRTANRVFQSFEERIREAASNAEFVTGSLLHMLAGTFSFIANASDETLKRQFVAMIEGHGISLCIELMHDRYRAQLRHQ